MSLGSRGDMEPFLALGEELIASGHQVAFCLPDQFRPLAEQVCPTFFPQSRKFIELVESPEVLQITGQIGSGYSRLKTAFKLLRETKPLQQQLIRDQKAAVDAFEPDLIIYHTKCVYPVLAATNYGQRIKLLSPVPCLVHPMDYEPSIGFGNPGPRWWNRLTYKISNYAMIKQAIIGYGKELAQEWGMKPFRRKAIEHFLLHELPIEFAVDQRLVQRPEDWPEHVQITHFRERAKSRHWTPDPTLVDFLNRNPKPLYIGFGSMVNGRPKAIGELILEVTAELNQPVIINTSWGGIEVPENLPSHAFAVSDIPYDWLFSRVGAVVHHGGSGTTHSALQFELRQLIIPHIADQFLWSRLLHKAGMGPKGIPIKKLNAINFKAALQELQH
ncbi:MAG: hypothetical protein RL754_139 [Bacteroidota bacterium]